MTTRVLDGNRRQKEIFSEIRAGIAAAKQKGAGTPGIAFLAFDDVDPLAPFTLALHTRVARELGFAVRQDVQPAAAPESATLDRIITLNRDPAVHAIVPLQPAPPHVDSARLSEAIDPAKEVEGFHPANDFGRL